MANFFVTSCDCPECGHLAVYLPNYDDEGYWISCPGCGFHESYLLDWDQDAREMRWKYEIVVGIQGRSLVAYYKNSRSEDRTAPVVPCRATAPAFPGGVQGRSLRTSYESIYDKGVGEATEFEDGHIAIRSCRINPPALRYWRPYE